MPPDSTFPTARTTTTASVRGLSATRRRRRPPDCADRRPPGPEVPGRRARRRRCSSRRATRSPSSSAPNGREGELPIAPAAIGEVLQPGHEVLIDDGMVRLQVEEVERGRAQCGVDRRRAVTSHKGVNLPGVPIPIPSLTRKDLEDLEFALELGVDYIALSFVRSAADVRDLRALIDAGRIDAHVIAKIEKAEAVDALDDDPRRHRRGDGRARRPRRRDRPGARPARAEADHPEARSSAEAGDHRDADARVDDPPPRADARGGERRRERDPRRHVGA